MKKPKISRNNAVKKLSNKFRTKKIEYLSRFIESHEFDKILKNKANTKARK